MTEMKAWQHGYELDYLKELAKRYERYNSYTDSPFAQFKKNNIAEGLHTKSFKELDDSFLSVNIAKVRSKISMHGDTVIGYKEPGDVIFTNISDHTEFAQKYIDKFTDKNCWLFGWAEDDEFRKFAESSDFKYVGCKITTFAEIYSVYFRDSSMSFEDRIHPKILGEETINICKCKFGVIDASKIREELSQVEMDYTQHYSNYNKKGAWSAISLRGYRPDPSFIAKPVEMSKKWKEENDTWEEWECEDTPLREKFPYVNEILSLIPTDRIERIRFMSLAPGGGELSRHTDQVDPYLGVTDGKMMRLHIPVITNPDMEFTSWSMHGIKNLVNMKEGDMWYLDIRKPHMAVNNGEKTRIHLVVDIEANDSCRRLLGVS